MVAHVPHYLDKESAHKHIAPAYPRHERKWPTFEKQGEKDKGGCPIERRGEVFYDIDVFQPTGTVQMLGKKGWKTLVVVEIPDEDNERRCPEGRLSELKRYNKANDGERVEGHIRDELPVFEGVLQPFRIVRCIFGFIGEPVVLVY